MYPKLQYISKGHTVAEQLRNIHDVLDGGCQWIQLRFKNAQEKDFLLAAEKIKLLCSSYNATFIVNDHPQVALSVDADGVHLGLQDKPVKKARIIIGAGKIIGGTANTFDDVLQRYNEGCNYIGLGPFRFTATKEKLSPVLGIAGYANIIDKMLQQKIDLPVYAIGGIVAGDVEAIMQTGIYGIAVSDVITSHSRKKQIVHTINSLIYAKAYDSK